MYTGTLIDELIATVTRVEKRQVPRAYRVGDSISYKTYGGTARTVRVTGVGFEGDRPVFDGVMANGLTVWGYDDQISDRERDEEEDGAIEGDCGCSDCASVHGEMR